MYSGPVGGCPFGDFRVHFLVGVDVHRRFGDQEDLVAVEFGERGQITLGVPVIVAVADVEDVHASMQGDIEQTVVRAPRQCCAAAVDQAARAEPGPAERSVGHAGPCAVVGGFLGGGGRGPDVPRAEQHLAANADHGGELKE